MGTSHTMRNIHLTSNGMINKLLRSVAIACAVVVFALPVLVSAATAHVAALGTPSVNGSSVSVTGNVESGFARCGSTGGGGVGLGGDLCFCCQPGSVPEGVWSTCQIDPTASYTIKLVSSGATVRSGSISLNNVSYSPSGCTLECRAGTDPGNWCKQTGGFSLSESALPAGDYTVNVTTTDCKGPSTASKPFTIAAAPLTGSCFTAQTSYPSGSSVGWDVSPSGGTGTYTYAWSLPDGSSATIKNPARTYTNTTASPITKTANLTVTSGSQTKTSSCSVTIQPAGGAVGATCSATSPANPKTGDVVTWTAVPSGGNNSYTYSWSGSDSFPAGATVNPVTAVYTTEGTKNASVIVTSNGVASAQASCSVNVIPPDCKGNVNVTSNLATTWSISGPQAQNQGTDTTAKSYTDLRCGSYTISPAAKAGYSVSVAPAASQSLSTNGATLNFAITYTSAPPGPLTSCSANPTSASPGQSVVFTANGGTAPYAWTTVGGTPSSGSGNPYSTSYSSSGTKTASVTSNGTTVQCTTDVGTAGVPSVDIEANGSDGPLSLTSGSAASIAWGTQYVTACTASGSWSGSKTPFTYGQMNIPGNQESTGPLAAGTYTYTITCTKSGQPPVTDSVTVNVTSACVGNVTVNSNVNTAWALSGPSPQTQPGSPGVMTKTYTGLSCGAYTISPWALAGYTMPNPVIAPAASQTLTSGGTLTYTLTYNAAPSASVDIKANNSDAPAAIVKGSQALLSWTSQYITADSCTASAAPASVGWSGAKTDNGSQNSAAIGVQTIFTITCRNAADTANVTDSVTVSVRERQCNDTIDNDGDQKVDNNDPGCGDDDDEGPPNLPQCSDAVDNADAEDTLIDDNDPGCITNGTYDPNDNDERNAGIVITPCNDGLDNDGDGNVDDADNGCVGPTDPSERAEPDIREI